MYNSNKYYIVGFFISLFLYAGLIVGLELQFKSISKTYERFTAKKDNFLSVTLVERKDVPKQSTPKEEPKQPQGSSTPKQTTQSVLSLFQNIDTKNLPKDQVKVEPKPQEVASRLKGKNNNEPKSSAKSLLETLDLKNQSNFNSTSSNAKFDEFKGGVTDILDANWQQTIDTISGLESIVMVIINSLGDFSYTITSLSRNDLFNQKLVGFLEKMKNEKFPPCPTSKECRFEIKFKDLLE
ncbi:MAG: TonB C-terminal domain-containing protein [Campylobacteraceae bacterium]